MSRDLPDNPNLEHLKKQAKALLDTLRERQPDATLTDAQHVLARDYGFASWPKLKAHVEEAVATGGAAPPERKGQPPASGGAPLLFDRFTEAAKRTLFFSRFEASSLGRLEIAPEHVLLGVIRGAAGSTLVVLREVGIRYEDARAAVDAANAPRDVINEPVQIPFQPPTKSLFVNAAEEADRLGHRRIATVHLLLALLRNGGAAASYLQGRGMTLDSARRTASTGGAAAEDDEANS
jgi:hypothetical protein